MEEQVKLHELELESGTYETAFNRKFEERKPYEPARPERLVAFMPGTVEEILVKEGDKVKKGDVLVIFRAMKMNNTILAPFDARVKKIGAEKGKNLPKNALLVELEA